MSSAPLPIPVNPCDEPDREDSTRVLRLLDLIDELQSMDDNWPTTKLPVGLVCADFLRALEWPNSIITAVLGFDVRRWTDTETASVVQLANHEAWGDPS